MHEIPRKIVSSFEMNYQSGLINSVNIRVFIHTLLVTEDFRHNTWDGRFIKIHTLLVTEDLSEYIEAKTIFDVLPVG